MNQFVYPSKFVWDAETYRNDYGQLAIEPLEKGYGVTIGNALRRVLLSSIPGIAFTAVSIEGVAHEFTSVPGVREDVVEMLLNIKQVALKPVITDYPHTVRVQIAGAHSVSAGDLVPDGSAEVLNPDLHIVSLDPAKKLTLTLEITRGFGYVPTEKVRLLRKDRPIGTLLIDGIYTPVRKVTFHVEHTRVGQSVDYEKLILQVWTTGAVSPKDAVFEATEVLVRHFTSIQQQQPTDPRAGGTMTPTASADLDTPLSQIGLSTRLCNTLASHNITTLRQLLAVPRERLTEIENIGEKSLKEIEEALKERGCRLMSFAAPSPIAEDTDET